jgi:hypothetical protein
VSRSTLAGAQVVGARAGELTDTLVVALGANDAGNPAAFRQRVDAVLAAAGAVPRVLWLTIPEVRSYYPAANQVLRDAAAVHPNLRVVDWHVTASIPGMTSSDGLHLTPAGARAMSLVLVGAALTGGDPVPAPPPPTTPPPPEPVPTTVPPDTVPVDTLPADALPSDTTVPTEATATSVPATTAPATTTTPPRSESPRGSRREVGAAANSEVLDPAPGASTTLTVLRVAAAATVLVLAGLGGHAAGSRVLRRPEASGRSGPGPTAGP